MIDQAIFFDILYEGALTLIVIILGLAALTGLRNWWESKNGDR